MGDVHLPSTKDETLLLWRHARLFFDLFLDSTYLKRQTHESVYEWMTTRPSTLSSESMSSSIWEPASQRRETR